jgi:ATP-dependent DNA helicase RecG
MHLHTSVKQLKTVGPTLEKKLHRLGIKTVRDLLLYFPFRYEDFSHTAKIAELQDGELVTIKVKIELIHAKRSARRRTLLTEAVVADETGQLKIIWFGQGYIAKTLKVGDEVFFSGKVSSNMFGLQLKSPTYEMVKKNTDKADNARIMPMYALTAGITHKQMRVLILQVIDVIQEFAEWIPKDIIKEADIISYQEAIRSIHIPISYEELKYAEKRLKFDEIFLLQLRGEMVRQSIKRSASPNIVFQQELVKKFVAALPFELTCDQRIASWEILQDIEKDEPMNRLLEGDVGSGKTVVAGLVTLNTIAGGLQTAIMAPTEILARQHLESFKKFFEGKYARIVLIVQSEVIAVGFELTEKTKVGKKREVLKLLKAGDIDIAIGTHALLSTGVDFHNLGLIIVDEQHRFGVKQRKTLKEKSGNTKTMPHFLSMTATPIPRSFALSVYGDLDISIIKTMPKGRKTIATRVVDAHNRGQAYDFIRDQVKNGRQVFVICPLIEEKDGGNEKKSVLNEYKKLSEEIFKECCVGFLHGKLKAKEKDETMQKFVDGSIDILVATSVVEVGVNIANATVMMIEDSERFGLAQLHQFRGRVGRSTHQSYCFLFTDSKTQKSKERLDYFASTADGFALAEYDLETRGPGEVYGTTQSGLGQMKLSSMKDIDIIKQARSIAKGIDFGKYKELKKKVVEWENMVHLE